MKPIADWRRVLTRAWSVRLLDVSLLMDGLEFALPYLDGLLPVSPGVFLGLGILTTIGAGVARVIAQTSLRAPETEPDYWENGEPE